MKLSEKLMELGRELSMAADQSEGMVRGFPAGEDDRARLPGFLMAAAVYRVGAANLAAQALIFEANEEIDEREASQHSPRDPSAN